MERNIQAVLEAYQRADFSRRLNLYLQFPELRSAFLVIDQAGDNATVFDLGDSGSGKEKGWKNRLTAVASLFSRL